MVVLTVGHFSDFANDGVRLNRLAPIDAPFTSASIGPRCYTQQYHLALRLHGVGRYDHGTTTIASEKTTA